MSDSPSRHAWRHASIGLALVVTLAAIGCKTNSRSETNRRSSLDASRQPAFGPATEREPVTAPITFEETTTTTTTTEFTEVVVEEREPTVLTIAEPTPAPVTTTTPPAAAPPATAPPAPRTHTIAPGDTLSELSQRYLGTAARWPEIVDANPGIEPNRLLVGTEIVIPGEGPLPPAPTRAPAPSAGGTTHTIAPGDTLSQISQRYYGTATRWQEIVEANPGIQPNRLIVGNELVIP